MPICHSFNTITFDIIKTMTNWQLLDIWTWFIPNALPQANYYMEKLLDNKSESILVFVKDTNNYTFHKPRVPQKYKNKDNRENKMNSNGRCVGNVLKIPAYRPPNIKQTKSYHPAAFPDDLISFCLDCFTNENETVLDPFVGSGTVLKICHNKNRNGIGIDINENFLPVIQQKIMEPYKTPDYSLMIP